MSGEVHIGLHSTGPGSYRVTEVQFNESEFVPGQIRRRNCFLATDVLVFQKSRIGHLPPQPPV